MIDLAVPLYHPHKIDLCYYCGSSVRKGATVDHIIPKSKGGRDAKWNKLWACVYCNRMKAAFTLEEFLEKLKTEDIHWAYRQMMITKVEELILYRERNKKRMIDQKRLYRYQKTHQS